MEHINLSVLDGVLDRYQAHLDATRPKEVYKWEAVKHFKETYNPAADDLSAMLVDAFQVGGKEKLNLAFGPSWFPIGMLDWFIQVDSRGAFAALDALWDESGDLRTRMVEFEAWAKGMLDSINAEQIAAGIDPAKSHFQDSRSMSLYLAFMRPESHYLYKTRMYTDAAKFLGVGWPGNKFDKVIAYREMCGQILEHLEASRRDLIEESDRILGELTEYDPNHHMLVQDIVYYITKYDKDYRDASGEGEEPADDGWFPSAEEYDPGIDPTAGRGSSTTRRSSRPRRSRSCASYETTVTQRRAASSLRGTGRQRTTNLRGRSRLPSALQRPRAALCQTTRRTLVGGPFCTSEGMPPKTRRVPTCGS